ncbi:MAG: hypothetical protein N4A76_17010 [Firmicutes bacterium]|jgi:hypothetical protein|nr:hypothetical protein [Bacillota bacterium]
MNDTKMLLNEIINLKERRKVLENECGVAHHNMNEFSKEELSRMIEDMESIDVCMALDIVNSIIEKDEYKLRENYTKSH